MRARGVERLWVGGLATDYCVKATVCDGCKAGFKVLVIEDASRRAAASPGDCERARQAIRDAGAVFVQTDDVLPA